MSDMDKAVAYCRAAQDMGAEISDACARVIASMYHGGQKSATYALASSGYLPPGEAAAFIVPDLFGKYGQLTEDERMLYDMMGTYVLDRVREGRVGAAIDGWSNLWL